MFPGNPQLKLSEAVFDNSAYLDHNRLDNMRQNGAAEVKEMLNSQVLYAYGSNEEYGRQNFPILWATQAQGNKRAVNSIDGVYYNYLFGRPKKTSTIVRTIQDSGALTGKDGEEFILIFKDRFFQKNQIIYWGGMDGIQVQLGAAPVKEGSYWKYKGRMLGARKGQSVPFAALQSGAVWSGGPIKVSLARSRGAEHRSHAPYGTQNQLSTLRHSFNVAGNADNKVMNFDLKVGGKTMRLWSEWERYNADLDFAEKRDVDLLISKYNKDAEGVILNMDADSGETVYSGMGMWDQIPASNELPYTTMTEAKFSSYIDDILSITGQLDMYDKTVVVDIMGGLGFLREVNDALKRNMSLLTPMPSANMFARETKGGLEFGNYFVAYKHISGVVFRFSHHKGFDEGALAASAPRHPQNPSRPTTSYNAFIASFNLVRTTEDVDKRGFTGNVQYVYEAGRELIEKYVPGMAPMRGIDSMYAASDVDASGHHMICTQGIHCFNPMSMGKIVCVAN